MDSINDTDQQVREIARSLDLLTEDDVCALYGITHKTAESWRKHGQGPQHVQAANRPLYPRSNVAADLQARQRQRSTRSAKDQL